MKTRNGFVLFPLFLFLLSVELSWAQPDFRFTITATDQVFSSSVIIGLNGNAGVTYGIDTVVLGVGDTLREIELPPLPFTGSFYFRSMDLPSHPLRGSGLGVAMDVRHSSGNPLQADTIILSFRSSDDAAADKVTLSWPTGLGSVGYGGFVMTDGDPENEIFPNVDMTEQTSFTYPVKNSSGSQSVYVIIGDGYKMRSFEYDSIANARNSKGKQDIEKRTPYICDGTLVFTNLGDRDASSLTVKFGTEGLSFTSFAPFTSISGIGSKKIIFSGGTLPAGDSVAIVGTFSKSKIPKGTGQFLDLGGTSKVGTAVKTMAKQYRLHLNMPNINNVGSETYAQPGNVDSLYGIYAGLPSTGKAVIHPAKWKNLYKTFTDIKTHVYQTGPARCFDKDEKGEWVKIRKGAPASKYSNKLLAEQLTLKINIAVSVAGKTPIGFGSLEYFDPSNPNDLFNGQTIDTIVSKVDRYLAYCDSTLKSSLYTGEDLYNLLHKINGAFSGAFDTLTFGNPGGGKPRGTTVPGTKPIIAVDYLHRTSAELPAVNMTPYSLPPEAPEHFVLEQNYPNPFNPTTTIQFNLPADAFVTVKVYNMLGQEVATLADREEFSQGENELEFNAQNLASGVYFYRVIVNDTNIHEIKRMLLLK